MKKRKSIILTLVTLILFCLTIMGCGDKVTPKESAQILWNARLKQDISNIEKLGDIGKEWQEALEVSKKAEIQLLKTNIEASGVKYTDEQLELVYDVMMEACAKNIVTIEETAKEKDSAEVNVKCTYIDEAAINKKAVDNAIKSLQSLGITKQNELVKKATELYMENLIYEFKNAEVSSETVEQTFKFKKDENGYWMPELTTDYIVAISKMATNQR